MLFTLLDWSVDDEAVVIWTFRAVMHEGTIAGMGASGVL